tara:strand:- start:11628 stop:12497 length:870 start_codon:yes stop_codon:yes gene_type:complete
MDVKDVEKINQLAMTLKNNGLAASMAEAVEKAKEIILGVGPEAQEDSLIEDEIKEVEDEIEQIETEPLDVRESEATAMEVTEDLQEAPPQEVQQDLSEVDPPSPEFGDDVAVEMETTEAEPIDVPEPKPAVDEPPIEVSTEIPEEEDAVHPEAMEQTQESTPLKELVGDEDAQQTIDEASDVKEELPSLYPEEPVFGDTPAPVEEAPEEPIVSNDPEVVPSRNDELPSDMMVEDASKEQETVEETPHVEPGPIPEDIPEEAEKKEESEPSEKEKKDEEDELGKYFNFGQ